MERLIDGYLHFQNEVFPHQRNVFSALANEQHPRVLFITCSDSRVIPSLITQSGPGELFVSRNPGNIIPPYGDLHAGVASSIEYAMVALKVEHIVVCGHSNCGAMNGLLHPEKLEPLPSMRTWLRHSESALRIVQETYQDLSKQELLNALTEENVMAQLENLKTHPTVASRLVRGQVQLHGWVYNIEHGHIHSFDSEQGSFQPLEKHTSSSATPRPRLLPLAS